MLPAAESTRPLEVRILRQVKPLKLKPGRGFKINVIFFLSAQKAGPKVCTAVGVGGDLDWTGTWLSGTAGET